jgi:hypothetical protein
MLMFDEIKMKALAREYASYFQWGLDGISQSTQLRINEIEYTIREDMGIEWKVFSEEVMRQFEEIEKKED